ncbi:hypothetical protein [Hymenobacter sp. DG01]|uniref:hypothetical protein n=1 Tax=Hymenobacter sp. DG01 TaxID=2584940 RepID=UPI00111FD122|nr:hypothetical protein [Hymenobacter sp. DG01]
MTNWVLATFASCCIATIQVTPDWLGLPVAGLSVNPASYFRPPCDLLELNREYVGALNYKRHQALASAPIVRFDSNLLFGTVQHNQRMQEQDSLFHDYATFHAELVGGIADVEPYRNNPRKLAHYIWSRFNASPKHAAIQQDVALQYVSISCSSNYFVVRLDTHPSKLHRDEQVWYRQWLAAQSTP